MKHSEKQRGIAKPSPAMVVAVIALIAALSGSAYAALRVPQNSVGTRQLKAKAVTSGKIAEGAITATKVEEGSLTGADINMAALGKVPTAANADNAANANALNGHSASCPPNTTLIRGLCFDSHSNPAAPSLEVAAEDCAAKGGWLPSPMELYSARGVLYLGTGTGTEQHQYTDAYYGEPNGGHYFTEVIDGTGAITQKSPTEPSAFICVYPLVR